MIQRPNDAAYGENKWTQRVQRRNRGHTETLTARRVL